jgi:uncharacterized protein YjbI with pentapeptide repeats
MAFPPPRTTCSYEGCNQPEYNDPEGGFEPEGKCVFHAKNKRLRDFQEELEKQIQLWKKGNTQKWDFRGWVFVTADFSNWTFEKEVDFSNAVFKQQASFEGSAFNNIAKFEEARFSDDASFEGTTFGHDVLFSRAIFVGHAQFSKSKFEKNAFFGGAIFEKDVWYSHAKFAHIAGFVAAQFKGMATFVKTEFDEQGGFERAEFDRIVLFDLAKFPKEARFEWATFKEHASFSRASFGMKSVFSYARFLKHAIFEHVNMSGIFDMSYVVFGIIGEFVDIVVCGNTRVIWPGAGLIRDNDYRPLARGRLRFHRVHVVGGAHLDLSENYLQNDSQLIIEDTYLENVLFRGTDCSRIEFYHCAWPVLDKRRVVGDEYLCRRGQLAHDTFLFWEEIEITYQLLAIRFREDLDHKTANDFECGMFEARRESVSSSSRLSNKLNWLLISLYRWVSRYSGSILWPFLWLLGLTLLCGAFYENAIYGGWIRLKCGFVFPLDGWAAALRVVTLNRFWLADAGALSSSSHLAIAAVAAAQVVFSAIFVTLFVFAVRRRFKHGE